MVAKCPFLMKGDIVDILLMVVFGLIALIGLPRLVSPLEPGYYQGPRWLCLVTVVAAPLIYLVAVILIALPAISYFPVTDATGLSKAKFLIFGLASIGVLAIIGGILFNLDEPPDQSRCRRST